MTDPFERSDQVEDDLKSLGFVPLRRSQLRSSSRARASLESDALIIDSTGELAAWQFLPDIVIIGNGNNRTIFQDITKLNTELQPSICVLRVMILPENDWP